MASPEVSVRWPMAPRSLIVRMPILIPFPLIAAPLPPLTALYRPLRPLPPSTALYRLVLCGTNGSFTTSATTRLPRTSISNEAPVCASDRGTRSEEHTSELQSLAYLVCRLLLEKKKKKELAITEKIINVLQE